MPWTLRPVSDAVRIDHWESYGERSVTNKTVMSAVCGNRHERSQPFLSWLLWQYMLTEGFKIPRSIQANTWPAVLRGRHVIGITPPHSGKTTAYLPALVTELLKTSQYLALPKGCGVSWRSENPVLVTAQRMWGELRQWEPCFSDCPEDVGWVEAVRTLF